MAKSKFEQSLADGAHQKLQSLIGKWTGLTKTWFEKDILADESMSEAEIISILGGRFISIDYNGFLEEKPFEGKMIIGYDIPYQRFTTSWLDSFHMGTQIMLSGGKVTGNGFSVFGEYGNPEYGEQLWGWRTTLEIVADDEFVLTAFNVSPEGEEAKATETVYRRK